MHGTTVREDRGKKGRVVTKMKDVIGMDRRRETPGSEVLSSLTWMGEVK